MSSHNPTYSLSSSSETSSNVLVVIPARFNSQRLPGKLLLKVKNKTILQYVYENSIQTQGKYPVYIATDSEKIYEEARSFGAPTLMTSSHHRSGTERVAEVAEKLEGFPWIVNLQGDEPEMPPHYIDILVSFLQSHPQWESATLAAPFENPKDLSDPSKVKVVIDHHGRALYFSRSPIPYSQNQDFPYFRHIGLYAFQREFLLKLVKLPPSSLEKAEKLEQLRVLENGYTMGVKVVEKVPPGIDTQADYLAFQKRRSSL